MIRLKNVTIAGVLTIALLAAGQSAAQALFQDSDNFDTDPGWIGVNNTADSQNFGYSAGTNNAGGTAGEIGGTIIRTPQASYATNVGALDASSDALSMSGSGILVSGSGNVLVGWFNSVGDLAWEPTSSFMGFRSDDDDLYLWAEGSSPLLAGNLPGPFTFEVTYDPNGNGGGGTLTGIVNGGTPLDINLGNKDALETFDRFGLLNLYIDGNDASGEMYFDNLEWTSAIPEPTTLLLMVGGALAWLAGRRRVP